MNRLLVANVTILLCLLSQSALCQIKNLDPKNLSVQQNDIAPPNANNIGVAANVPNNTPPIPQITANNQVVKADLYLQLQDFLSGENTNKNLKPSNNTTPPAVLNDNSPNKNTPNNNLVTNPNKTDNNTVSTNNLSPSVNTPPITNQVQTQAKNDSPVPATNQNIALATDNKKTLTPTEVKKPAAHSDSGDILDSLIDFKSQAKPVVQPASPAQNQPIQQPTNPNIQTATNNQPNSNTSPTNNIAPQPLPIQQVPAQPATAQQATPVAPQNQNTNTPASKITTEQTTITTPQNHSKEAIILPKAIDHKADTNPAIKEQEIADELLAEDNQHNSGNLSTKDASFLSQIDEKRNNLAENKKLSPSTNQGLSNIANQMIKNKPNNNVGYIDISHDKNLDDDLIDSPNLKTTKRSKAKIDIAVTDPSEVDQGKSSHYSELDAANKALISGQVSAAIRLYKNLVNSNPKDVDALFGLASAYQRDGQKDKSTEIYNKILKSHPRHKEALNNFLALASEEAPEDALFQLQKLERINPNFSPVQAQIAMIYLRTNRLNQSEIYFRKALELSPDNLIYQYNLAITLDKQAKYSQAIPFYQKIVDSSKQGLSIPGSYEQINERLNFLKARY